MADDFDIIIIGAGIAGTACALRCARAGLSVLLLERGELPGSKNLSGGRLYCHALAELLPHFQRSAPLERRITHESLALLTDHGATMYSSLQPNGDSWSVLRARFDPWFVSQAEAEGVQCITGATVEALHRENNRVCGVICDKDILRARYVVVAEGANSVLAEREGLLPRPSPSAMALGIKAVLSLEQKTLEDRFHLTDNEGAAMLFTGGVCGDLPGAHSSIPIRIPSHSVSCARSLRWEKGPSRPPICWNISKHTRPCGHCCAAVKPWSMAHIWCLKAACIACPNSMQEKAGCWLATPCVPV